MGLLQAVDKYNSTQYTARNLFDISWSVVVEWWNITRILAVFDLCGWSKANILYTQGWLMFLTIPCVGRLYSLETPKMRRWGTGMSSDWRIWLTSSRSAATSTGITAAGLVWLWKCRPRCPLGPWNDNNKDLSWDFGGPPFATEIFRSRIPVMAVMEIDSSPVQWLQEMLNQSNSK